MSAQGKKKRQFSQSENLRKALSRDGVEKPGAVANYLLQEFLHNGGRLRKESARAANLCLDKKFDEWRNSIREAGWVVYVLNRSGKWMDYHPTPKLVKYINAEKSHHELATRAELDHVNDNLQNELDEVKERVSLLEQVMKNMIGQYNPPVTQEKIKEQIILVSSKTEIKKQTKKYNNTPKEPSFTH